jgi:hypothetical protein
LWKTFLAADRPQNSSSLDLKEPLTSPPPHGDPDLLIWESTFDTLICALGCHQGFLCKAIHLDVDSFTSANSLAISLRYWHVTARICIVRGMAERQQGF